MEENYVSFDYMSEEEQAWEQYLAQLDADLETMSVQDMADEILSGSYFEYCGPEEAAQYNPPEFYIAGNPDQTFVLNRSDCDHWKRAAARIPAESRDDFMLQVMELLMEKDGYLHCLESLDEAETAIIQWSGEPGLSDRMKSWRKQAGEGTFTRADGSEYAQVSYCVNGDMKVVKEGKETLTEMVWDIDSTLTTAMSYRWFGDAGSNAMTPQEMVQELRFYFGWKVQLADLDQMQDPGGMSLRDMDLSPFEVHISRVTLDCGKAVFGANCWFRQGADLRNWVRDTIDEMLKQGCLVMANHCLGMAICVLEMRQDVEKKEAVLKEWTDWFMTMDSGSFRLSGGRDLGELHFYRAGNGVMIYDAKISRKGSWTELEKKNTAM